MPEHAVVPPRALTRRMLGIAWLVVALALWNGVFDLYHSRGVREYLQVQAEFEARLGPEPVMADVLERHRRDGVIAATLWALVVGGLGLATLRVAGRPEPPTWRAAGDDRGADTKDQTRT